MIIAIVEDSLSEADLLQRHIERYASENDKQVIVHCFTDGLSFISNYKANYDAIFMDIKMPDMNGFEVAKQLRDMDKDVCLIFVTTMAQFAIRGYEVNALDYMLKPVEYHNLADKLARAERYVESKKQSYFVVKSDSNVIKLNTNDIIYIEKDKNYIIYHTLQGSHRDRGTLGDIEKQLNEFGFGKCTHGCLINFRYVIRLNKNSVQLDSGELPLSRRDRKDFVDRLIAFCGGMVANG